MQLQFMKLLNSFQFADESKGPRAYVTLTSWISISIYDLHLDQRSTLWNYIPDLRRTRVRSVFIYEKGVESPSHFAYYA